MPPFALFFFVTQRPLVDRGSSLRANDSRCVLATLRAVRFPLLDPRRQCHNGGKCNPDYGKVGELKVCLCPEGYASAGCKTAVTHCLGGSWCTNGGKCPTSGGAMCSCPLGFSGGRCQEVVEMVTCKDDFHCLNGGKCNPDQTAANTCVCPDGYAGAHCQKTVTRCLGGNYCENGGVCSGSTCSCPRGFEGGHCQIQNAAAVYAPAEATAPTTGGKGKGAFEDGDKRLAAIVAVPLVIVVVGLAVFVGYMVRRERQGQPLFSRMEDIGAGAGASSKHTVAIEVTPTSIVRE